jgi:hypothetical protein
MLYGMFFFMSFALIRGYHDPAFAAGLRQTVIPVALGLYIAPDNSATIGPRPPTMRASRGCCSIFCACSGLAAAWRRLRSCWDRDWKQRPALARAWRRRPKALCSRRLAECCRCAQSSARWAPRRRSFAATGGGSRACLSPRPIWRLSIAARRVLNEAGL